MIKKKISPSQLHGSITIQPSKSMLHRSLICAALADGKSVIRNFALSEDIQATLRALHDMGFCRYELMEWKCAVTGGLRESPQKTIDCGESGSTLRFLLPLSLRDGAEKIFTGHGRLLERPMEPYERLFLEHGVQYRKNGAGIAVQGQLQPGLFQMAGNVSSQFITGMLLALPMLPGDSVLELTTPLESKPYVDLTRQSQEAFGVYSQYQNGQYHVKGGQEYRPCDIWAEGDYSHAAFFAAAGAMGGKVALHGLRRDSLQGDKEILGILQCMGAVINWDNEAVTVECGVLKPLEIDVSQIPDLVPVLSVLACAAKGRTRIFNAARLRYKESDRLHAMTEELEKLGADVIEYEDSLVINGTGCLRGGAVSTHGDHRIAMALSVASGIADADIILDDAEVVKKSAPRFFTEWMQLGGKCR